MIEKQLKSKIFDQMTEAVWLQASKQLNINLKVQTWRVMSNTIAEQLWDQLAVQLWNQLEDECKKDSYDEANMVSNTRSNDLSNVDTSTKSN
jgi:hypothetical protein